MSHNSLSFEDHDNLNHVFKFKRIIYGLKQAPKNWYKRLSEFLIKQALNFDKFDTTLFFIY